MDTIMRDSPPPDNRDATPPIPSGELPVEGALRLPEARGHLNGDSIYIQQDDTPSRTREAGVSRGTSPGVRSSSPDFINSSHQSDDEEDYSVPLHSVLKEKPPKSLALPYTSKRSGLVYDVRMRHHTEIQSIQQDEIMAHPEDPKRIFEIFRELEDAGLVSSQEDGGRPDNSDHRLWRIAARRVSKEEVCLVHAGFYYEGLKELNNKTEVELYVMATKMDSVYLHWETFSCAELSAGGAIEACRAVLTGTVRNAIAVIRPPGHHAEHDESRGFCFFNNVAIAARVCQRDFPDLCRKVLIVDWDVHHGNGIQQAFYNDPSVLYISIHLHKDGEFYPSGDYGDHLHCGEGAGLGFNVNIPWKKKGMGDGDYMLAFQQVLMPIATEFDPDLVIVASGFDAADGDTLGGCHVMPAGYAHMTHMLMSLAKGKVAVCLEGGYNLRSIAKSALAVTRTLMGEPPDRLGPVEPTPSGVATIQSVVATQSQFWNCLYPKSQTRTTKGKIVGERMHDVVRAWQARLFWDHFRMSPLFILRNYISPSFTNQVVATSNYGQARPLLVMLHDPPEPINYQDPSGKKTLLHNLWLSDPSKYYVEQAIKLGFAVIDVNVPLHITDPEDDASGYLEPDEDRVRRTAIRELMTYLWNNYIEVNESPHIFFMGIGGAYSGIIDLLNTTEGCSDRVSGVIGFLEDTSLEQVKRPGMDSLSSWYFEHSLLFLSPSHPVWQARRKMGRKYGNIVMVEPAEAGDIGRSSTGTGNGGGDSNGNAAASIPANNSTALFAGLSASASTSTAASSSKSSSASAANDTVTIRQMLVEAQSQVMEVLTQTTEEWRARNPNMLNSGFSLSAGEQEGASEIGMRASRLSRSSEESLSSLADESFDMKMSEADAGVFGASAAT